MQEYLNTGTATVELPVVLWPNSGVMNHLDLRQVGTAPKWGHSASHVQ